MGLLEVPFIIYSTTIIHKSPIIQNYLIRKMLVYMNTKLLHVNYVISFLEVCDEKNYSKKEEK
jgi:hypothetical protein